MARREKDPTTAFGRFLRALRKQIHHEGIPDFAKRVGLSESHYGRWERGDQTPFPEGVEGMARAYGADPAEWRAKAGLSETGGPREVAEEPAPYGPASQDGRLRDTIELIVRVDRNTGKATVEPRPENESRP